MSSRVLRRLRQEEEEEEEEEERAGLGGREEEEEAVDHVLDSTPCTNSTTNSRDDYNDDDDYEMVNGWNEQTNLFMHMKALYEHDDSSSSSSSSSSSCCSREGKEARTIQKEPKKIPMKRKKRQNWQEDNHVNNDKKEDEDEEEDIHQILSEFITNDDDSKTQDDGTKSTTRKIYYGYNTLLRHPRDWMEYNIDDTILHIHDHHHHHGTTNKNNKRRMRRNKKRNQGLFARHRDGWGNTRPNNYLGGGLGMICHTLDPSKEEEEETWALSEKDEWCIPWPYCRQKDAKGDAQFMPMIQIRQKQQQQKWYSFQRSSVYIDRMRDYQTYIANTGDVNAMAMFIADHPYIVEPLFHLAMFFFSLGENEKGMEVIKRILWIMECACHGSLLYGLGDDDGIGGGGEEEEDWAVSEKVIHLMDINREENEIFFRALFWLSQTCCRIGCIVTSLAVGKFLLSLDPLRDPMGILLVLDYYALATMRRRDDVFVVNLVDSGIVNICYKEEEGDGGKICNLREMPNWAYSYALALYRTNLYDDDTHGKEHQEDESGKKKLADEALDYAILRYPHIPRLLLEKNGVNLNARSFQCDWPSLIGKLDSMDHPYNAGINKIETIFVERSYKLFNDDHVQKWLFGGCQRVTANTTNIQPCDRTSALAALERYSNFDPMDMLGTFRRIPVEDNPLDPRLMDAAMNYTPNRRRFLRINRNQGGRGDNEGIDMEMLARQRPRTLLGTGRDGMEVIDPDLPLVEIFWRSFLPWARVDGVPPHL